MATILRTWSYKYQWLYDGISRLTALSVGGEARFHQLPLQGLKISSGTKVLDLCCGSGQATKFWCNTPRMSRDWISRHYPCNGRNGTSLTRSMWKRWLKICRFQTISSIWCIRVTNNQFTRKGMHRLYPRCFFSWATCASSACTRSLSSITRVASRSNIWFDGGTCRRLVLEGIWGVGRLGLGLSGSARPVS